MSIEPVAVGVVGCGTISDIYLRNCARSPHLHVVACADLDLARAEEKAAKYGVPRACSPEELLADPAVELVLNLTVPVAHASVARAALHAGKSVYNEKPLTVERADAAELLAYANANGLRIGGAPDTFLGGGLQTCRELIDQGAIGRPVAAMAHVLTFGPEPWHPSPAFFYQHGGGPLFDMGPYYLTALVSLLGPIATISGSATSFHSERTVGKGPLAGTQISVEVPTHLSALLEFAAGPVATLVASFDVGLQYYPELVIHGTDGSLQLPDPNGFGGPVRLLQRSTQSWQEMPISHANISDSRGIGLADMAAAIRADRSPRAGGELAYHVLDAMHAVHDSAREGRRVALGSSAPRPAPLPSGLPELALDDTL